MDKKELRAEIRQRRKAIPASEKAAASLALGQNLAAFLDSRGLDTSSTVAVYQAMSEEISLAPFIALLYAQGSKVAFPCTRSAELLEFYQISAQEMDHEMPDFIQYPGRFFPEEDYGHLTLVQPGEIDVMLVPAVAYDKARMRLGMGAGCYDRYLPQLREDCLIIGVCFDEQLVEEIPTEEHDLPVDVVITPSIAF